jgi:hypothetical protein
VRLGCFGCLAVVLILSLIGGILWVGIQALREPDAMSLVTTPEDGVRAQQKIFAVVRRGAHRGDRDAESVILSEREVNAFLSRHLGEIADLPFSEIGLRLPGGGIAEFRARLPLRSLLAEPPLSAVGGALPASWLEHRVWLRVGTRPRLEPDAARRGRRYLRLEVVDFTVGRQPLPGLLLRLLLDPSTLRVLRWPAPEGIEDLTIEAGRVVVRTAS